MDLKQFIINKYGLTPLQEKALDGNINTVVSASAGTGKTHTLVAKLMYGILNKEYTVDNLLAITYTNAGASEMKNRLKLTLSSMLETNPEFAPIIEDQIKRVETASITTIHGFCKDLINNYSYLLDEIDPAQINNVLDEGTVSSIKDMALINTMDKFTLMHEDKMENLIQHFVYKPTNLRALEEAIVKTSDLIRFEDKSLLVKKINDLYFDFDSVLEIKDEATRKMMSKHLLGLYEDLSLSIDLAFIQDYNLPPLIEFINHREEIRNFKVYLDNLSTEAKLKLSTIKDLMDQLTLVDNTMIIKKSYLRFQTSAKRLKELDLVGTDVKELYQAYYNAFKDMFLFNLNKLIKFYRPNTHSSLVTQRQVLLDLLEIASFYQNEVDKLKQEYKGLDFNDQIFYAFKILEEHKFVVEELREKYNIILIDEFQDTNSIQDTLVTKFAYENQANVFRVGDIKQSIYGFQGAEPNLMYEMTKDSSINNLVLNQNFRSKEKIIKDVNNLFASAMNIYEDDVFTAKDLSDIGTRTFNHEKIQTYNTKAIDNKIFIKEGEDISDVRLMNAYEIARSINQQYIHNKNEFIDEYHPLKDLEAIKEKYDEYEIDETNKLIRTKRPFMYKDIVVLIPAWSITYQLEEAFTAYNIPSDIIATKGFYQTEFIKGTSAWFKYLESNEKSHLIDILYYSLGLTYDEIISLNEVNDNLLESFKDNAGALGSDFYETIKKMRYLDSIDVLIELANYRYRHDIKFSSEDMNNYDLLVSRVSELANSKPSISDFVTYLDTVTLKEFRDESDKFSSAKVYSKNDNVVKVMTYHASKGLEFPVVYVWPIPKRIRSNTDSVFYHKDLGLVIRHIDEYRNTYKNIYLEAYLYDYYKKIHEENIRLFYVAFTRAEYRAHVFEVIDEDPNLNIVKYIGNDAINRSLERFWLESYKPTYQSIIFKDRYLEYSSLTPYEVHLKNNETNASNLDKDLKPKLAIFNEDLGNKKVYQDDPFEFNQNFIEATNYGTLVHDSLEKLVKYETWDEALFDELEIDLTIRHQLYKFKNNPQTNSFFKDSLRIEEELPILTLEDNKPVQNVLDLHLIKENELIIIDYKTDYRPEDISIEDFKEVLINRYTSQLKAYKKAIKEMYPDKKIISFIYSFNLDDYLEI